MYIVLLLHEQAIQLHRHSSYFCYDVLHILQLFLFEVPLVFGRMSRDSIATLIFSYSGDRLYNIMIVNKSSFIRTYNLYLYIFPFSLVVHILQHLIYNFLFSLINDFSLICFFFCYARIVWTSSKCCLIKCLAKFRTNVTTKQKSLLRPAVAVAVSSCVFPSSCWGGWRCVELAGDTTESHCGWDCMVLVVDTIAFDSGWSSVVLSQNPICRKC